MISVKSGGPQQFRHNLTNVHGSLGALLNKNSDVSKPLTFSAWRDWAGGCWRDCMATIHPIQEHTLSFCPTRLVLLPINLDEQSSSRCHFGPLLPSSMELGHWRLLEQENILSSHGSWPVFVCQSPLASFITVLNTYPHVCQKDF